jgi:hypothetical protein
MFPTTLVRALRALPLVALVAFPACGGSAGLSTGSLVVKMHDHPISGVEDVGHVYVTIESVEVMREEDGVEIRETVASTPGQYDLLELQNGVEAVLGGGDFPAGEYRWIRLIVAKDTRSDIRTLPADQLKNYIVVDGTAHPLVVPSGHNTGIKLGHSFTIAPGGTTVLTLDFDVRQSVHVCGRRHANVYRLKPRIKVVPVDTGGAPPAGIAGSVSTTDGTGLPTGTVVSAQQGGVEVGSDEVDGFGAYSIAGLADGAYDLVVIAPGYGFASETNVVVTGGAAAGAYDFAVSPAGVGAVFGVVSPAGDVTVRLVWNGFVVATVAADPTTGDYVVDNVPAGSYTVEATDGTSTDSGTADVTAGNATQVDLSL